MQQAPLVDGLAFDPFSCLRDGLAASEVDVGRGEIAEALVVAPVVVIIDEGADLGFESTGQKVVFEQDAVLQRLVPSLDLALGLRMARRTAGVLHPLAGEPGCQFTGDVTGTIVRQQPRTLHDLGIVAT